MGRLLAALHDLGAVQKRDGVLQLELSSLDIGSLFGGPLTGAATCTVQGDAVSFSSPLELAACGRLWVPDVADSDALIDAIAEAHNALRGRIDDALTTLRRLGFKARLVAPEPRARGAISVDGANVVVVVDTRGDLVVDTIDGRPVSADLRRGIAAPEEATAAEALALVTDVVSTSRRRAPPPQMSQDELDELQAALDDDDDLSASSEEAEPTAAGVPMPVRQQRGVPSDFDDGGTLQLPMERDDFTHELPDDPLGSDDSDLGTLKVQFDARDIAAARAAAPPTLAPPKQASSLSSVPSARAPSSLPSQPAPRPADEGSLLDEFDDDDVAAPVAASDVDVDIDVDLDDDEDAADGFADPDEPTATRPHVGVPTRAAQTRVPAPEDDEENDLLAALDADHAAPPPPVDERPMLRNADAFDGFPGLANDDDDGPGFFGVATSVNASADVVASAPPTAAVMPSPRAPAPQLSQPSSSPAATATRPAAAATRNAFDDDVTGAVSNPAATANAGTDDDFDDGKTRALVVDEALLARLKLGDAETPRTPATPTPSIVDAPFASDDDDGLHDRVIVAEGEEATQTPIGASAEEGGDTPSSREATAMAAPRPGSREPSAADDLASLLDDAPIEPANDDGGFGSDDDFGDDDDDADAALLATLVSRERALLAELERVRLEIVQTRGRIDVTDHGRVARRSQLPTQMPLTKRPTEPSSPAPPSSASMSSSSSRSGSGPIARAPTTNGADFPVAVAVAAAVSAGPFAAVGASADHSAEAETSTLASPSPPASSSLLSLQSIDVHEVAPPPEARRSGLLDAFDDDGIDDSDSGSSPAAPIDVRSSERDPDGFDDGFSGFDDAPAERGAVQAADDDDDGVSLADLQGALQEMGVDLADPDPGHTQVAAAAMPFALPADADDGDVFGTGSGSGSSQVQRPAVSELSHEETRVRQARPASIGIVVEDERARLRLRKHLVDKFADLVEAASTEDVAGLDAVEALDAIVIVRPTDDDATRDGFARLNALARRPRVLVISSDEQYDDHDAVDLRLPLAQKASEVAKQVLDGLERLGIQSSSGL